MHGPLRIAVIGAILAGFAVAAAILVRPRPEPVYFLDVREPDSGEQAVCPWREPERDMAAFFPGANRYRTVTLSLTGRRDKVVRRLGPGARQPGYSLRVHQVLQNEGHVGDVIVRRLAGPHGAMEVVVAVRPDGKVAGVRIQRLREPKTVTAEITSARWLRSFVGRDASSRFRSGDDLAAVLPAAAGAADVISAAVRAILIERAAGDALLDHEEHEHPDKSSP